MKPEQRKELLLPGYEYRCSCYGAYERIVWREDGGLVSLTPGGSGCSAGSVHESKSIWITLPTPSLFCPRPALPSTTISLLRQSVN